MPSRIPSIDARFATALLVLVIIAAFVAAELALSTEMIASTLFLDGRDGAGYLERASGPWLQTDGYHGPAYSWAIRVVSGLGMDPCRAARWASGGFAGLFLAASWRLLAGLGRRREALLACALLATHPLVIRAGLGTRSDMMGAALFVTALAIYLEHRMPHRRRALLAGAVLGLAYMTRFVYVLGLAIPVVDLCIAARDRSALRRALAKTLSFGAGFLGAAAPWLWHVATQPGVRLLGFNHINVAFKLFHDANDWGSFPNRHDYGGIVDVLRRDPAHFFESWGRSLLRLPYDMAQLFPDLELLCAAGALVWLFKGERRHLALVVPCACYAAAISMVHYSGHHLVTLAPLAAGLVAAGLAWLPNRLRRSGRRTTLPIWPLAAGAVVWICAARGVERYRGYEDRWASLAAAADALREHAPKEARVWGLDPAVAELSGTRPVDMWRSLTENRGVELGELLRREDVDYVVLDANTAAAFPRTAPLYRDPESARGTSLFEPIHVSGDAPTCGIVVFSVTGGVDAPAAPNIVILDIDILRADALPCFGNSRDTAPNLCRFGAGAVLFERNFSPSFWTLPALVSTLTAQYPSRHGLFVTPMGARLRGLKAGRLAENTWTLPSILAANGYSTHYVGQDNTRLLNEENGMLGEFEQSTESSGIESWLAALRRAEEHGSPFFVHFYSRGVRLPYSDDNHGRPLSDDLRRWSDAQLVPPPGFPATPRALELASARPVAARPEHYFPPRAMERRPELFTSDQGGDPQEIFAYLCSIREELEPPYRHRAQDALWSPWRDAVTGGGEAARAYARLQYDTKVRHLDRLLGPLLDHLSGPRADDTIVVVSSTHGEFIGEHDLVGHGRNLFQEVLHTPLMVRISGFKPTRIAEITQHVDILPTLLDALGIRIPERAQGLSLLPWMRRGQGDRERFAISEMELHSACIQSRNWKLIARRAEPRSIPRQLFHLAKDPREEHDLLGRERALGDQLGRILDATLGDPARWALEPGEGRALLDDAAREQVQRRGYF